MAEPMPPATSMPERAFPRLCPHPWTATVVSAPASASCPPTPDIARHSAKPTARVARLDETRGNQPNPRLPSIVSISPRATVVRVPQARMVRAGRGVASAVAVGYAAKMSPVMWGPTMRPGDEPAKYGARIEAPPCAYKKTAMSTQTAN